jgi:hypothetical protein
MPHGPALLTAQLHKALTVGLRYAGAACLHSARRTPRLHRPTTLVGSWSGDHEARLPGGGAERGRAATGFGHGRSGAGRVATASDRRCRPGHERSAPLWRGCVAALARPGREWCGAWCQVETGL